MRIKYVDGYVHLQKQELVPIESSQIFCDPPDTEIGSWVGSDLISESLPSSVIIDLGSGSGATIAALIRKGAKFGIGVDISQDSIVSSRNLYSDNQYLNKTRFEIFDILLNGPEKIEDFIEPYKVTTVISNPAYVPLKIDNKIPSLDGGEDGLKFLPAIIKYAQHFKADLGITLGSYSSLHKAFKMIRLSGFQIITLTLTTLPFSDLTIQNFEQIKDLSDNKEALLWHNGKSNPTGYIIVGIAAKNIQKNYITENKLPSEDSYFNLIKVASSSLTNKLEKLTTIDEKNLPEELLIRVLNLPIPNKRLHW